MGDSRSWAAEQEADEARAQYQAYLASPQGLQDKRDMQEWNYLLKWFSQLPVTHLRLADLTWLQTRSTCVAPEGMNTKRSELPRLRRLKSWGISEEVEQIREEFRR